MASLLPFLSEKKDKEKGSTQHAAKHKICSLHIININIFLKNFRNLYFLYVGEMKFHVLLLTITAVILTINHATIIANALALAPKRTVAVFGGGGYLGALSFGYLQRASSIYGTGIGTPRCIGATAYTAVLLNKVLGSSFKLAFAGEECIDLTDMSDVHAISKKLVRSNVEAVVVGTKHQLERRPVTANTYESKNPNTQTYEFYLDERKNRSGRDDVGEEDEEVHASMFANMIGACRLAECVKHAVIIEAPGTSDALREACIGTLKDHCSEDGNLKFTYIQTPDELSQQSVFTYESGVFGGSFLVKSTSVHIDEDDDTPWLPVDDTSDTGLGYMMREDLAGIAIQSLISLDWDKNRVVTVSTQSAAIQVDDSSSSFIKRRKKFERTDREWLVRSSVLAKKLEGLK